MGSQITRPSNKSMVDRLVENHSYINTPSVEGVFRAVDRAMYFNLEEGEATDPYDDDPWRRGNLHLSAPCIYAKVVEALDLRPGLSFLNLGSGTGYLNTIIGLLVGPNGVNHGIEFHADVVEYAYNRLQKFKQESYAIDKYDFSEPIFIQGNCLNINPDSKYDRIYLGAACLPNLETFMKKLLKPNGGVLVMPYESHLMRYVRVAETEWKSEKLMTVNFTLMIRQGDNEPIIDMPRGQAKTLKELCRIVIRQQLREKTNSVNPNLLHSDNIKSRRIRKAKAEREIVRRERRRFKAEKLQSLGLTGLPKKSSRGCSCNRSKAKSTTAAAEGDEAIPRSVGSQHANPPSTSAQLNSDRVMTRSAVRRLEGGSQEALNTTDDKNPISSSQDKVADGGDSDSWTSDDSGEYFSSNGREPRRQTREIVNNCARTRPINSSCSVRQPNLASLPHLSYRRYSPLVRAEQNRDGLEQSRIRVEPASSSSNSSLDSFGLHDHEEFDYIGRQFVVNWPADLGAGSSADSSSDLDDLYYSDEASSSSSLPSFGLEIPKDQDEVDTDGPEDNPSSGGSSDAGTNHMDEDDDDDDDDEDDDDDDDDDYDYEGHAFRPTANEPQPSTSMDRTRISLDKFAESSLKPYWYGHWNKKRDRTNKVVADSEPVARRLRSKRAPVEPNTSAGENNETGEQLDRPVPSCSRDEPARERTRAGRHCPIHSVKPKYYRLRQQGQASSSRCTGPPQPDPSAADEIESRHSSMRLSSESSSTATGHQSNSHGHNHSHSQSMFSGRVLITAGIGTTLSVATCHYLPDGRRSGFRFFERLAHLGPARAHHQHHGRLQQLNRKRKWRSSTESSEASNGYSSSSSRRGCSHSSRRRCGCPRLCSSPPKTGASSHSGASNNNSRTAKFSSPESSPSVAAPAGAQSAAQLQGSSTHIDRRDHSARAPERGFERTTSARASRSSKNSLVDSSGSGSGPSQGGAASSTADASSQHCRHHNHHHHHHHRHHSHHHHSHHHHHHHCQANANRRCLKEIECRRRAERKRRHREKRRRGANECKRYHNHMSSYIRQLPLPLVLHRYLNYDRNS